MSEPDTGRDEELEAAMADVYRGPREEFVSRRDALVKELRAAGRADAAKAVKSLRKPTLQAWSLDAAVHQDPSTVEGVAAAVVGILEAQDGRGELRPAMDRLQAATRHLASQAAQAAADGGHSVDQSTLGPVVLAVIGDATALHQLRAGRLAEIPTAGGLDLLTGAAPPPDVVAGLHAAAAPVAAQGDVEVEPEADAAAISAARDQLDQTESSAEAARQRSTTAEQAADDAAADLETAEQRLRQVEQQVREKRAQAKQTKQEARTATTEARQAERAAAKARAGLQRLGG